MDYLKAIATSPAVWAAIILILQLIARYAAIPDDITTAITGLLVAILAACGVGVIPAQVRLARELRAARKKE